MLQKTESADSSESRLGSGCAEYSAAVSSTSAVGAATATAMLVTATHTAETTSPDDSVPSRAEPVSSNTQETPKCTTDVHVSAISGEDERKATADSATVTLPEVMTAERLPCVAAPLAAASSSGPEPPKPPAALKTKLPASASTDAALAERSRPAVGSTPVAASSVADTRAKTIIVVDLGSDDDIKPPTTTKATTSVAGKKTHKTNPSDLLQSKQKQQIGISKGVKRPASSDSTRQLSTAAAADRNRPASGAADARKRLEGEGGLRRPTENEKTESSSSRGVVGNTAAGSLKQTEKLVKVR